MALATLQTIAQIKQKARIDAAKSPAVAEALRALFKHLEQNPKDLAYIPFTTGDAADVVLSDSPCKIYAIMFKKRAGSTTASWLKFEDATSVGAEADWGFKLNATAAATKAQCIIFPDGMPVATALEVASHTAQDGTTDSAAADSVDGFVLLGAP